MENVTSPPRSDITARFLQWSPIVLGALAATALSSVLLTFAITIGLGVASSAPTWRDASAALAILSGLYLIIQAVLSYGVGGYIAGHGRIRPARRRRTRQNTLTARMVWAFGHWRSSWELWWLPLSDWPLPIGCPSTRSAAQTSAAEPLLSYELDRLFRTGRRAPNVDLSAERAEAGRILLTMSSHSGLRADDRTYLIQQVAALTGLAAPEAERRVDSVVASAQTAIARSRRSSIILAFSVATAILLGAVAAWAAACVGGRHRDGAPLPEWMDRSNAIGRNRHTAVP